MVAQNALLEIAGGLFRVLHVIYYDATECQFVGYWFEDGEEPAIPKIQTVTSPIAHVNVVTEPRKS